MPSLVAKGFQVAFHSHSHSHAQAILSVDFPAAVTELEAALATTTIPIEEINAGGARPTGVAGGHGGTCRVR
jgi:hypothetical protein